MHPKDVGDQSTLAIMLALRTAGYGLYVPFGENTRTDLVIEKEGVLQRVQCKTGRLRDGAIIFSAQSVSAHHKRPATFRSYLGEIDCFAVYCPETDGAYLVPIEDAPVRGKGTLRVDPSRNGQTKRCRPAAAYLIG